MTTRFSLDRFAWYLTCAASVATLVSIAASQILMALAVVALLLSGEKLRFPPIRIPLVLFFAGTLISMFLSVDASSGRPQLRKFWLFLMMLIVMSTVRNVERVTALLLLASAVMSVSALWSLVQFGHKLAQAPQGQFYSFYTSERITGFMSHWMTVGGQEMLVLLMTGALLFWVADRRWKPWLLAASALILISLILGYTRSIWFGTFVGGVILLWFWRRTVLLLLPVPILLLLLLNPFALRDRATSVFQPHGDTDSNQFRYVCRRTGAEIIKAHPIWGIGPEQVRIQFKKWIPADIPRPLPTGWYGHLHNIYYHYAAERGIPTMLALMWLLGKMLWDFSRASAIKGADPKARGILLGAIASLVAMLIVGFYEVNLGDSEVFMLFLVVMSCAYVARDQILTSNR